MKSLSRSLFLIVVFLFPAESVHAQTGVIAGQIRGEDGMPAAGIRVAATEIDESGASALVRITETDELGRYRLEDVPPGEYRIVAGMVAFPTYFPGTPDPAIARGVSVIAGSTAAGVDFDLTVPVAPVFRANDSLASADASIRTMFFALFSVGLSADSLGVRRAASFLAPFGVAAVFMRFSLEDGSPLASPLPDAFLLSAASMTSVRSRRTDDQLGFFLLPGEYRVSVPASGVALSGDYYVKSMVHGQTDLLEDELRIPAGGVSADEIIVTLAAGIEVAGAVRTGYGVPAVATVYLTPEPPSPGRPDLPRRGVTDEQGNFALRGVAPGGYMLSIASGAGGTRASIPLTVTDAPVAAMNLLLDADGNLTMDASTSP